MKTLKDVSKYSLAAGYQDFKEKLPCDFSLGFFSYFSYLSYNIFSLFYHTNFSTSGSRVKKKSSENFQKACRANYQYSHWYTGYKIPWTACSNFVHLTYRSCINNQNKKNFSLKKSFIKRCFTFSPGAKRYWGEKKRKCLYLDYSKRK